MTISSKHVERAYKLAAERYAMIGVDTEIAMQTLSTLPISIHCWQGDDVTGFESTGESLSGGIAVTGNYPGKARTASELRSDFEMALSLIPGNHRINLHAIYGEFGGIRVDRDAIELKHFTGWIDWAKSLGIGIDFNPTCFSHPKSADGLTLSHPDRGIRKFWIQHCIASREIGAAMGKSLGSPTVTNVWIPDGYKDTPADRAAPRERLADSLNKVFANKLNSKHNLDAVESKLFGIGSESYVVGSHEFYLGYAIQNQKLLCLDAGHFHPTESVADKISAVMRYVPGLLLHVSRPVRWDSDHVVTIDDNLLSITREIIGSQYRSRIHIGLDYFDASVNRVAAWVLGTRNTLKALLIGLLEPAEVRVSESEGDLTVRLALMEESKSLPWSAVWDEFCQRAEVPVGANWLPTVKDYERSVLAKR